MQTEYPIIECSAKTGTNIEAGFTQMAKNLMDKKKQLDSEDEDNDFGYGAQRLSQLHNAQEGSDNGYQGC